MGEKAATFAAPDFYVVRYVDGVPARDRLHGPTEGRFATWADAEDHRLAQPNSLLLEVQPRTGGGPR